MYKRSVYNRKKYQRAVNKTVRDMNKNILQDWLWDGRFYVRQVQAEFHPFEDHSGAIFHFLLKCVDTKTGREEYRWFDNYSFRTTFFWWVNGCITEKFKVWEETPDPREQARLAGRFPS